MREKRKSYSRYSKEIKLEAVRRVLEEDQPVQEIVMDLGIRHRDNVYEWIKKFKKHGHAAFDRSVRNTDKKFEKNPIEEQMKELKIEVEALKAYLKIIFQCEEEKYKAIEILKEQYPVDSLCNALDVSKVELLEYQQRQLICEN